MRATTNWRGRGRGRGPGRGNWSSPHHTQVQIQLPPPPPLGDLCETLKPHEFEEFQTPEEVLQQSANISKLRLPASYNWAGGTESRLIFPGLPPLWKPLKIATQPPQDSGEYFRDQNAARYPKHPLEPAVSVLLTQDTEFETGQVDAFACTSTLGNLLRFLKGDEKPFRFTVEAVGRTVFFTHRENARDEKIFGPKGYGPTGYEHYTEWAAACKGSTSHQRIIAYDFNKLHLVVRFEADGYLEDAPSDLDEVSNKATSADLPNIEGLTVKAGGHLVPQSSIFELKTRSIHKKTEDHLADNLPRLWVAQIPHFILTFHEYDTFAPENISVRDVRAEVQQWQDDNADLLRRYGKLVEKLISLARDPEFGKYEVCYRKPGQLEIRNQGGRVLAPLSARATEQWLSRQDVDADSNSDSSGIALGANAEDSDGVALSDDDDDGFDLDYTICSNECDYCGRCRHKAR